MNIRGIAFRILDQIKGTNSYKHLYDIKKINDNNEDNYYQLQKILEYSNKNTDYYKNQKYEKLIDYPVINKSTILDNYDKFISDEYKNKKTHTMSTSGSTGTPFVIKQNKDKRSRVMAELMYANEIGHQQLGEKYFFVRTTSQSISGIRKFKNNEHTIEISKLNDFEVEKILDTMEKNPSINSMLAYPSTYEEILRYLRNTNRDVKTKIKTLFSSGAVLAKEDKLELAKRLNCKVLDRYSNQECGVLAQTDETGGVFKVNRASYRIELLKMDSDLPTNPGELGRIVITDLYNKAMPLIRYDNGDLGISFDEDMHNIYSLVSIEGRKSDIIFDTNGQAISPHMWTAIMRKYPKLKQWQLIQNTEKEYDLKLNVEEGIYDYQSFLDLLKAELGVDASIKIILVDEIPVLDSGKFKATICNL